MKVEIEKCTLSHDAVIIFTITEDSYFTVCVCKRLTDVLHYDSYGIKSMILYRTEFWAVCLYSVISWLRLSDTNMKSVRSSYVFI